MIDARLRSMIDEALPEPGNCRGNGVEGRRRSRHVRVIRPPCAAAHESISMLAPADSLFDQTVLLERAQRLVKAAKAAGADAADAVAVRNLSLSVEVREGAVEESESAEGDDLGLRVLVGKRQAMVSSNDLGGDVSELAQRAVAMARVAPDDKFAGLAAENGSSHANFRIST